MRKNTVLCFFCDRSRSQGLSNVLYFPRISETFFVSLLFFFHSILLLLLFCDRGRSQGLVFGLGSSAGNYFQTLMADLVSFSTALRTDTHTPSFLPLPGNPWISPTCNTFAVYRLATRLPELWCFSRRDLVVDRHHFYSKTAGSDIRPTALGEDLSLQHDYWILGWRKFRESTCFGAGGQWNQLVQNASCRKMVPAASI